MHTIGDDVGPQSAPPSGRRSAKPFVLVTGGLGATTDDLTNEAVIRAWGCEQPFIGVRASIAARWPPEKLGDAVSLDKLSLLPEGAGAGRRLPHGRLPAPPPRQTALSPARRAATDGNPLRRQGAAGRCRPPPRSTLPVCQRVLRLRAQEVEINKRLLDRRRPTNASTWAITPWAAGSTSACCSATSNRGPTIRSSSGPTASSAPALGDDLYGIDGKHSPPVWAVCSRNAA